MKIIDLLNKIAKGEEVPKIIKFWEREYILDEEYNCYLHQTGGNEFIDLLDNNNDDLQCFLNDEVEIIEEDKEENEIPNINLDNMKDIGVKVGKAYRELFEGLNKGWNTPLEEDKKIEKIDIKSDEATPNSYYILNEHGTECYLTKHSKVIADKVDELIDKVNKLEKEE